MTCRQKRIKNDTKMDSVRRFFTNDNVMLVLVLINTGIIFISGFIPSHKQGGPVPDIGGKKKALGHYDQALLWFYGCSVFF